MNKVIFPSLLLPMILVLTLAGGLGLGSMDAEGQEIRITGRIYILGSEPFTRTAIERDDGKVFVLTGKYDKQLRGLQGKRVKVTGLLTGRTPRGIEAIDVTSFQIME